MRPLRCKLELLAVLAFTFAVQAAVPEIDASRIATAPGPLSFPVGGVSPTGHTLSANQRYLTLDGKPWFPLMGEFHFSRVPAEEWDRELLKMKAGGITVVSTYVFWIHHEETEDHFNWTGQRDLGRFIRLCAQHGLYVWLRVGPWAHGEARNGGFPDWLVNAGFPLRENNPAYLAKVRRFYSEISAQVHGQFWADGGPIVGLQIENEYHPAAGGIEHMTTLREMALEVGMNAPFVSATGWDRATIPPTGFLPVFGGYTEQFWSSSVKALPPNQNFFFTPIRAEDNVMGDLSPKNPSQNQRYDGFPYLTAEMGAGMSIAYHRRPVMQAKDSTAAAIVKLGSGITGLGFYMYHGGTNPDGLTSLQETLSAWHGYNDMEVKSYDFQAPIGEFGQINETYRTLKTIALFVQNFGADLAPMLPSFPSFKPKGINDVETPRAAVRSDGDHAYIFLNNFERNVTLPRHDDFQLTLKLAGQTLSIPRSPISIPSNSYAIWPVNLRLAEFNLRYSTAQPLARLGSTTWVFFAPDGLPAEFAFDESTPVEIEAKHCRVDHAGGTAYLTGITPGVETAIHLRRPGAGGQSIQIIVLSERQALDAWQAPFAGNERIWLSPASLTFGPSDVHVASRDPMQLNLEVYPAIASSVAGFHRTGSAGIFEHWISDQAPASARDAVKMVLEKAEALPAPARVGPASRPVPLEPLDDAFAHAASWTLNVPSEVNQSGRREFLSIAYIGDVARIYVGDRLDNDNFYKGTSWELGLWRYTSEQLKKGLTLKVLPLRPDAPVFLEKSARPSGKSSDPVVSLIDVKIIPEYEATLSLDPKA